VPFGSGIQTEDRSAKSEHVSPESDMNVAAIALALAAATAPSAEAAEALAAAPLKLRPKAAFAPGVPQHASAPFVNPVAEPELDLLPRRDVRLEASRSSCSGERSLCYDPQSGRIVYKPARGLMPDLPGLQRENISVKRDRIVLRYSF
jgi:hypothetical protein